MSHYETLGVAKTATADEIKRAYRILASRHHPDKEGGDTAMFQKIQAAYETLSDPQKRQEYDSPQPQGFTGGFNPFGGGNPFEDIMSQFMRQQQRQQRIYTVTLWVSLDKVARGSDEVVQFNTATGIKTFNIKVPQGVEDGQQIRYDGLMPDGALQIEFRINRHPDFDRRGLDLYTTVKLSVWDFILGTTVQITTILGDTLEVTIPARTNPGATLRIQGHGLESSNRRGDQFLLLSAKIPDTISEQLLLLIQQEQSK